MLFKFIKIPDPQLVWAQKVFQHILISGLHLEVEAILQFAIFKLKQDYILPPFSFLIYLSKIALLHLSFALTLKLIVSFNYYCYTLFIYIYVLFTCMYIYTYNLHIYKYNLQIYICIYKYNLQESTVACVQIVSGMILWLNSQVAHSWERLILPVSPVTDFLFF